MTEAGIGCCPECGGELVKDGFSTSAVTPKQRYKCRSCGHRTSRPAAGVVKPVPTRSRLPKVRRYVITCAQNATPVHAGFWAALQRYREDRHAELVVIPLRYRNPTSQWTAGQQDHEWWAEEVVPHLAEGRFELGQHLTILGDVKVQPTAERPLRGLEAMTRDRSGIVGHPKLELLAVPTPHHRLPKLMTTTGAVTVKNYTDSKAGKKGDFHHTFGAAVVELDGDRFYLRQLNALEDGSFTDLDRRYTATGVEPAPPVAALVMGDTHVDAVDPAVVAATFGAGSMVEVLRPRELVWHDLLDFRSRNHHDRGDPFGNVAKRRQGVDDVRAEVERACAFVDAHGGGALNVIVPSNHPAALARWVKETDWRADPTNAEFYLETALAMARGARVTPHGIEVPDPFVYWAERLLRSERLLLPEGGSHLIAGVEVGFHGHEGPNGARGSARSLSRIGVKTVIGHSHSPAIAEGCYQTGTSTHLRLDYQGGGPSSWLQCHCVIYADGKRSLLPVIRGHWRLPE